MVKPSRSKGTKKQKPAGGKLAGKTVAFVGKFGYRDMFLEKYQGYAHEEGGQVVDLDSTVPDYLVVGEGRGGKPPSVVAKVQKQHPTIQILDEADFCRLLLPSREELYALLRSGPSGHEWGDRFENLTRNAGSVIDLNGVDLRKVNLYGAHLRSVNLSGADLRGASAHYVEFDDLKSVQGDGADLSHAYFYDAADCSFRQAILSEAWFSFGQPRKYEKCDFTEAKLNKLRGDRSQFIDCVFAGSDLSDAEIRQAHFLRANLAGADLSRAHCSKCQFDGSNLERAVLVRTDLRDASLVNADLRNADLHEAVLSGADLTGALVEGADFAVQS